MRAARALAVLAAALAGASCVAEPAAGPARSAACTWPGIGAARCATVRVPENRAKPGGRAIPLRVLVLPATGRAPAADPVVFLAGGPGQAATGLARFHRNSPLRRARDLVFADQRGTGGSGDLRCAFYSTGGSAARFDDFIPAATVPACRERLERSADLSQYTTAASVADLEDVRRALGYDSLNLVGGSYGTRLAMEYLRAYPSRVRTVTLEGAVPPTMPVPEAFGVLAQRALDGVLDECLADAACGRAFPDIKREARAVFERLRSAPVTVHLPGGAIEMTGEHVAEAIRYMLYSSEQASRVPLALHAAYHGDFTRPAQFLLDWRRDGTFDAVYLSITCTEDVPFVAPGADAHDRPTFLGDYRLRQQRAACQAWPRGDPPAWRGKPVEADVPALIVSGRLDPVTPPEKGAEVARTLPNSLHVQVPSGGHSWQGLAGVDCIERLKAEFIERGSVAGLDAACVAAIGRRGFGGGLREGKREKGKGKRQKAKRQKGSARRPMTILRFDGIEKAYGQTVALRGVSFEVPAGEIFGLLGPNGAGKSTLIRILMDIIRADRGQVHVFGEVRRREHLDRLGYLPEERGLYTKQPVLDVMTYFGALKGLSRHDARARSIEWLQKVELPHVASWKVDRLSKGMSQKVQIASVLLSDPEVCVLDEPTTGLDPVNVRLVQDLLIERRRRGRTTILSTHHMNQVEALCDRVALINQGRLVVYGAVDDVRRHHSLPEVRVQVRGPLPPIPAIEKAVQEDEATWRLLLANGTPPAGVLAALVNAGAAIERFEPVLAPMEDIFLRVVREARA